MISIRKSHDFPDRIEEEEEEEEGDDLGRSGHTPWLAIKVESRDIQGHFQVLLEAGPSPG